MKKYTASVFATIAIMILGFAIDSSAQSLGRISMNIPFDFYVGSQKLDSGTYEFAPANRQAYPAALIVRSTDKTNGRSIIVRTLAGEPGRAGDDLVIRFNQYGDVMYLSGITFSAGNLALRLPESREEKALARKLKQPVPFLVRAADTTGH